MCSHNTFHTLQLYACGQHTQNFHTPKWQWQHRGVAIGSPECCSVPSHTSLSILHKTNNTIYALCCRVKHTPTLHLTHKRIKSFQQPPTSPNAQIQVQADCTCCAPKTTAQAEIYRAVHRRYSSFLQWCDRRVSTSGHDNSAHCSDATGPGPVTSE